MKHLYIILLTLPFLGFSQDISGTGWKIYEDDGTQRIIIFENDGTFSFLNVKGHENVEFFFSGLTDTWMLNDGNIIISFTDGFMVMSGTINGTGDYMSGTWVSKKNSSGNWSGELIKF